MKATIYKGKLRIDPQTIQESDSLMRWYGKEKTYPMILNFTKKNHPNTKLTDSLLRKVFSILNGIDKCELSHVAGWWETSEGATFGRNKIKLIKAAFSEFEGE